ncbi:hypothetical protein LJC13_02780 [Peptostreptococcaceae bacterium OttesenSCG-928-C18]|nr:hypothetical protein [Peptostreptococcaceae bacterium OttesenSCG-928-C18]
MAASDGQGYWANESRTYIKKTYGSYRNGVQGGPGGTVSMSITKGSGISYTNSISGSWGDKNKIAASFGTSFSKTYSRNATYKVNVPKGRKIRIKYRPYYNQYKVVQRYYTRLDGKTIKTKTTKTSYVTIFQNWDYTWVYI